METLQTLSAENKEFYDKTLLKRMLPTLVFANYGQKKSLSKKSGNMVSFRKFNSLSVNDNPLSEGVTPMGDSLSMSEVKAQVSQYGNYVEISDMLDLVGIDPVLTETAELLGEQAGATIDSVVRDIVCSGTNVRYIAGQGAYAYETSDVSGVLNATEIQKAVRTLKNDNAKPFDGKYYIGIIDPDISYDIQQDPLFLDVSKYNGGTQIIDGEIGKLGKVRFVETTNTLIKHNAYGQRVHCAMIIGKDAYGIVDVEGSSKPEIIIKPHGSSGTADPLNQRATSGWKALFTATRLNELAMVRIECLTSADMDITDDMNGGYNGGNNGGYNGGQGGEEYLNHQPLIEKTAVEFGQSSNLPCAYDISIEDSTITITGEVGIAPEEAGLDASYTHAIALKITREGVDYNNVSYLMDNEYTSASGGFLTVIIGVNVNKETKAFTVFWNGVNSVSSTYQVVFSGATLSAGGSQG